MKKEMKKYKIWGLDKSISQDAIKEIYNGIIENELLDNKLSFFAKYICDYLDVDRNEYIVNFVGEYQTAFYIVLSQYEEICDFAGVAPQKLEN